MCRQFLTLYNFCQCEVDAGYQPCGMGQPSPECAGPAFETVTMHCFCDRHAMNKFKTEKKHQKHQRKASRSSIGSTDSASSRGSRYSDVSLVQQEKDLSQAPVTKRRWYRRLSGMF
ncbi:hypothetical protein BDW69DRAFT_174472 [Aspergillus filifer]